jgi:hypothetical protein
VRLELGWVIVGKCGWVRLVSGLVRGRLGNGRLV